jgi:hypothetical protein
MSDKEKEGGDGIALFWYGGSVFWESVIFRDFPEKMGLWKINFVVGHEMDQSDCEL